MFGGSTFASLLSHLWQLMKEFCCSFSRLKPSSFISQQLHDFLSTQLERYVSEFEDICPAITFWPLAVSHCFAKDLEKVRANDLPRSLTIFFDKVIFATCSSHDFSNSWKSQKERPLIHPWLQTRDEWDGEDITMTFISRRAPSPMANERERWSVRPLVMLSPSLVINPDTFNHWWLRGLF